MSWVEKNLDANTFEKTNATRTEVLEAEKVASHPVIKKEADSGVRPFASAELQEVKSPGIYEAEFGVRDSDVIFHFWPWGYHAADRRNVVTPKFKEGFHKTLDKQMREAFGDNRVSIEYDPDMGSYFVRARGWAEQQFHRKLSIAACEAIHRALGGEPG